MYGHIFGRGKFFLLFNKIFLAVQATLNNSYEKFGKVPIFAPESRTKFRRNFFTGFFLKPRCHAVRINCASKTPFFKAATEHYLHGNCYSSRPHRPARISCAG
jgi:hypothetical protein